MYTRILVPLEHSDYDDAVVAHVRELATLCSASIVLIHVADGWAARNQHQLALRESDEMKQDREYLETRADALEGAGLSVVRDFAEISLIYPFVQNDFVDALQFAQGKLFGQ